MYTAAFTLNPISIINITPGKSNGKQIDNMEKRLSSYANNQLYY